MSGLKLGSQMAPQADSCDPQRIVSQLLKHTQRMIKISDSALNALMWLCLKLGDALGSS